MQAKTKPPIEAQVLNDDERRQWFKAVCRLAHPTLTRIAALHSISASNLYQWASAERARVLSEQKQRDALAMLGIGYDGTLLAAITHSWLLRDPADWDLLTLLLSRERFEGLALHYVSSGSMFVGILMEWSVAAKGKSIDRRLMLTAIMHQNNEQEFSQRFATLMGPRLAAKQAIKRIEVDEAVAKTLWRVKVTVVHDTYPFDLDVTTVGQSNDSPIAVLAEMTPRYEQFVRDSKISRRGLAKANELIDRSNALLREQQVAPRKPRVRRTAE